MQCKPGIIDATIEEGGNRDERCNVVDAELEGSDAMIGRSR
jgi:hypothetical protein